MFLLYVFEGYQYTLVIAHVSEDLLSQTSHTGHAFTVASYIIYEESTLTAHQETHEKTSQAHSRHTFTMLRVCVRL